MSEARRTPRVVESTDNISTRLNAFAATYVKYVADKTSKVQLPIPVSVRYNEGHVCSALEARALNWALVNRAVSVAASNLARGAMKDKAQDEKVKYATDYLNSGYSFTSDLGGEFSKSLLQLAVERVVIALGKSRNGKEPTEKVLNATVAKMLGDPSVADKYETPIREAVRAILSETPAMQSRSRGEGEDEAEALDI